jgi:hypothetical protein
MKKLALTLLAGILLMFMDQIASAADCVEVDIELPDTVVAEPGATATGYFELTNCGDEAGTIWLAIDVDLNGTPFAVGEVPVYLGAGETISREFIFPVPPLAVGYTVTFCVTATSGEYEASDCATVTVEGFPGGNADKTFGLMLSSDEGECVEVDLELPDTVYAEPNSFMEGYFELVNCGDEPATIEMSVTLDLPVFDTTITMGAIPIHLGAGEEISREFRFPVPPVVPDGEYGICLTAVSGEAMSTACQTVIVVSNSGGGDGAPMDFNLRVFPNPANPSASISFELAKTANVTLDVFNILGQRVTSLENGYLEAGPHTYDWNIGSENSSGIYFYRLQVDDMTISEKLMILK